MKRTLFILGRTPKLAFLELQSFYPHVTYLLPDVAEVSDAVDPESAMNSLGGTVKIAEVVSQLTELTPEALVAILRDHVIEGKIVFGISVYGHGHVQKSIFSTVKQQLTQHGISVRYIEAKHDGILGSVVVSKQHMIELVVILEEGRYTIGITRAVQNFEEWNSRDSARPASDPHRGMLPPKVARMIVNIALPFSMYQGKLHASSADAPVLLDPFCGVGTVLAESLMRGIHVVGVDISADSVVRAKKNIAWLRAENGMLRQNDARIETGDATHVSDLMAPNSIDAIATEPFLGGPLALREGELVPVERAKNILKGLEKLYIGSLKEWTKVLKSGGRVVIAFPAYVTSRQVRTVKNVVDRCESLGYTLLTGPIEYSRPQAVVRREFYVFQKS